MKQVEAHCTLNDEDLSALLCEIDADWGLEPPRPDAVPVSVASISPRQHKFIRFKKPRRYPREDILSTRQEVAKLEQQLQLLQEKRALREALQWMQTSSRLDWPIFASRERALAKKAVQVNDQLRKHVDANIRLSQRFLRSIHRQTKTIPTLVRIDCQIVGLDNAAHIARVMRACLDSRIKDQLGTIINQYNDVALDWTGALQTVEWNTFPTGDRSVGAKFEESVVLPFSSSFIKCEIGRWPSLNANTLFKHERGESSPGSDRWKASGLDHRIMIRRLVNVKDRTIMLWEDAFCLQDDTDAPPLLVRGSGWTLVAPISNEADELSAIYSGGLIWIQAAEGSSLHPDDVLAKDIVAYAQLMQRSRIASLEYVLIDACRQQITDLPGA